MPQMRLQGLSLVAPLAVISGRCSYLKIQQVERTVITLFIKVKPLIMLYCSVVKIGGGGENVLLLPEVSQLQSQDKQRQEEKMSSHNLQTCHSSVRTEASY